MRARRVAALGAIGLALALAVSCVALIGADEHREMVVETLCGCTDLTTLLGSATCANEVNDRLKDAPEEVRAAWMKAAEARGCLTSCANALACYRVAPACSSDVCRTGEDDECCEGLFCKENESGSFECSKSP